MPNGSAAARRQAERQPGVDTLAVHGRPGRRSIKPVVGRGGVAREGGVRDGWMAASRG